MILTDNMNQLTIGIDRNFGLGINTIKEKAYGFTEITVKFISIL